MFDFLSLYQMSERPPNSTAFLKITCQGFALETSWVVLVWARAAAWMSQMPGLDHTTLEIVWQHWLCI